MSELTVEREAGAGRTFVLLYEGETYTEFAALTFEALIGRARALLVRVPVISESNWSGQTQSLLDLLVGKKVRQASFIGLGAAGILVQNLALTELRLVRTCVLVDSATRAHPSRFTRIIDRIESALPLGLPLRSHSKAFDGKPFLQRIRCPVLIITTSKAGMHERDQAVVLAKGLPVAWQVKLPANSEAHELATLVLEFYDVPARRPQKNLGSRQFVATD